MPDDNHKIHEHFYLCQEKAETNRSLLYGELIEISMFEYFVTQNFANTCDIQEKMPKSVLYGLF